MPVIYIDGHFREVGKSSSSQETEELVSKVAALEQTIINITQLGYDDTDLKRRVAALEATDFTIDDD